ncbi:unnamed protein product, partial [Prorocentrum cordatum]
SRGPRGGVAPRRGRAAAQPRGGAAAWLAPRWPNSIHVRVEPLPLYFRLEGRAQPREPRHPARMVLLASLGTEQLVAAASGALQSQGALASAAAAAEIAAIGVNTWGASLGLAACAAGVGAGAVAAAAGKLRCGADGQADDCPGGN